MLRLTEYATRLSRAVELGIHLDLPALISELTRSRDQLASSPAGTRAVDIYLGTLGVALARRIPMGGWAVVRRGLKPNSLVVSARSPGMAGPGPGSAIPETQRSKTLSQVCLRKRSDPFIHSPLDSRFNPEHLPFCPGDVEGPPQPFASVLGVPINSTQGDPLGGLFLFDRLVEGHKAAPFFDLDMRVALEYARVGGLLLELALGEEREELNFQRVSHELSNPTVGIKADADYALHKLPSDSPGIIERKLKNIRANAILLNSLVRMATSQTFDQPLVKNPRPTKVFAEVLMRCKMQMLPLLTERGLSADSIYILHPAVTLPVLEVDPDALSLAVYNLLGNAIKYKKKDPSTFRIELTAHQDQEGVHLHFRDWGIGIPETWRERVFGLAERTPEAEALEVQGTGLGLTAVRKIMSEHGGEARVTQCKDPTQLTLTFPLNRIVRTPPPGPTP